MPPTVCPSDLFIDCKIKVAKAHADKCMVYQFHTNTCTVMYISILVLTYTLVHTHTPHTPYNEWRLYTQCTCTL